MLKIACLSQKGGVGKSTLARLIAVAYAHSDWDVKIADFNLKQKTSTDWAAIRLDQGVIPTVSAEAFASVKAAIAQDYDLIVFDGRPDSDVSTLDIAKTCDLIVVPIGTTIDDLMPQVRFANELRSKGIDRRRIRFAINKALESQVAIEDARSYVRTAGYEVFETALPAKTGYEIAQNSGRAVLETIYPSLNERAGRLVEEIVATAKKLAKAHA